LPEIIIEQNLPEAHIENFTPYAMQVVISRALPSIEDGLKTVARRICYMSGTESNIRFRKGAHYTGNILSAWHPHGGLALYESIVLLSQDFFHLNPLILGRGNKGSILNPFGYAAERYLELRISPLALDVYFKEFNVKTNPMMDNYDKTLLEPKSLPARFPMVLVNSNTGIAVGYAVTLPSHNIGEIAAATIHKIKNPNATTKELMQFMPGPDYATGGYILNQADLPDIYEKGSGSIIIRGKIETTKFNGKDILLISEIPNTTDLGAILTQLANLCKPDPKNNNPGLLQEMIYDIKDRTDENKLEVHILPKKNVDLEVLKNLIFQNTSMQDSQTYNSNLLLNYKLQKNASLEFIIRSWLEFRVNTIRKAFTFELNVLNEKIAINNALIKAQKSIDDVIKVLRNAKGGKEEAKQALITKYNFAETEADYIVKQELYKISSLQINVLLDENKRLSEKHKEISLILPNINAINDIIIQDLQDISKKYSTKRRTQLLNLSSKIDMRELVEEKELFVAITTDNFIYSKDLSELKGGSKRNKGQNFTDMKKGKVLDKTFVVNNRTKLFCLTKKGILFIIDGYKLNVNNVHINNLIENLGSDTVISFLPIDSEIDGYLLTVNNKSFFKKTSIKDYFLSNRTGGIIAVKLEDDEELIDAAYVPNENQIVLIGTSGGYVSKFNLTNVVTASRTARGRPLIRLKEKETIVSLTFIPKEDETKASLLLITSSGIGKLTPIIHLLEKKTEKGISAAHKAISLKPNTTLLKNKIVMSNEEIIINTNLGKTIRIKAVDITSYSRTAMGDKLITLNENDKVNSINTLILDE
jgi:DNA gyrase subunit A